jgi:hypothetical protein
MDEIYTQKFKISFLTHSSGEKEEEILFVSSKTHGQYILSNMKKLNGFWDGIISSKYRKNYRYSWEISDYFRQENLKFPIDVNILKFKLIDILKQCYSYFNGIILLEPTDIKISKEDYIKKGYKFKT